MRTLFALLIAVLPVSLCQAQAAGGYLQQASAVLPGSGHSWGFAALQPGTAQLFIARRENGLTVFDVERQQAITTLAHSEGANAVAFAPARNRAYAANMDGSLSIIDLAAMKVLRRLPIDRGNLNNLAYLPRTGQLLITGGRRAQESALYLLDLQTEAVTTTLSLPAAKLDAPLALDDGRVLIPMRDESQVAVLQGPQLQQRAFWRLPGCSQPSALAAAETQGQLYVACRGGQPVLVAANLATGAVLHSVPVGHAVNTLAYDAAQQQVLAPSGADAELRVFQVAAGGELVPRARIGTRPWAHNMVFDPARQRAYLLAMGYWQALGPTGEPTGEVVFQGGTFTVLTVGGFGKP